MAVLVLGGIVLVLLIQSAPFLFDHGSGLWRYRYCRTEDTGF